MATKRLSMRQTREILRQKLLLGRSHRDIAGSLGLSVGAVGTAVLRARVAGLDWPLVQTMADDVLDARLYRRKPGVTLQLLHMEYLQQHPTTGYRYTQFCGIYNRWLGVMSIDHGVRRRRTLTQGVPRDIQESKLRAGSEAMNLDRQDASHLVLRAPCESSWDAVPAS